MPAILLVIILLLGTLPAHAEEVSVDHDGFQLIGELQLASGKTLQRHGVIVLLHDAMGDFQSEPVSGLQRRLVDRGLNVLAINLSLGQDLRAVSLSCEGEQNHQFGDALPEVHAWVKWLQRKKVRDISLAGFGLGALQMGLYASKTTQKAVRRAILMTPTTRTPEQREAQYQQRFGRQLGRLMLEVEQKIAADFGGTLLEGVGFLNCDQAVVAARAFVSYYRDQPFFNTPQLINGIKMPTLVVAAELDSANPDLVSRMQEVEARSTLRFDLIESAEREFGDVFSDQLADRIKLFINEIPGR